MALQDGRIAPFKGVGQVPFLAALSIIEFVGPCRFSHFDRNGFPVAVAVAAPWIQLAATAIHQTVNTMDSIRGMLVESPLIREKKIDVGKTIIQFSDGHPGKIEPVTSNSATLEGGRPTFAVLDETHHWTESNGGHKVAKVIDRNIRKNPEGAARYVESTNAYNPAEDSVAQVTHEAAMYKGASDILYDCVEAPGTVTTKHTDDQIREALKISYGDSSWVDVDSILAAIRDPRTPEHDSYRFYFNQIKETIDTWIPSEVWTERADELSPIKQGDQIAIGFDGSLYDDCTAMIGCRLTDGKLFVLGIWDPADNGGEVDVGAVDATFRNAFKQYRVAWVYADPYYWQDIIDRWSVAFGEKLVFKFPTNRVKTMAEAVERFHTSTVTGQLVHDGDPMLAWHIGNALTKETPHGVILRKDKPKSKNKIDAAVAAILAYEARGDAIADGRMKRRTRILGL
ncbi:terminase TerL endonuclease subunit [Nocardiopsis sp. NPDC049922]|uniref:terminase TerL endonuclease subunit n=1 Tax=Nocardiopsis sp. NPDC049922 TaxID=3155157 RepID=UPI0033FD7F5C